MRNPPSQYSIMEVASLDDVETTNESLKLQFPLLNYSEYYTNPENVMKTRLRNITGVVDVRPSNPEGNKLVCSFSDTQKDKIRITPGDCCIKNTYFMVQDNNILEVTNPDSYFDSTSLVVDSTTSEIVSGNSGYFYVALYFDEDDDTESRISLGLAPAIPNNVEYYNNYCILSFVEISNNEVMYLDTFFDPEAEPYISRQTFPDYSNNLYKTELNGGVLDSNGSWRVEWPNE